MSKTKFCKLVVATISALCAFIVSPPPVWADPACHMTVDIKHLRQEFVRPVSYPSLSDLLESSHYPSDPFRGFSSSAEEAVLEATERVLCAGDEPSISVDVEITFVELLMRANDIELERLRAEAIGANGAYAEIAVDVENKQVSARIIWNPRRMLRDQLLLRGWNLDEVWPLLPFPRSEYNRFISNWEEDVLRARSHLEADRNLLRLKQRMQDDLYGLLANSSQTTQMSFRGATIGTVGELMNKSAAAYTLVTVAAIDQGFDTSNSASVTNIYDINRPDIERLYEQEVWGRPSITP